MNKNYHNKKKEEYIIQKLSSTQIDKVWHPIIADIIMRRQFEYELSDEIFERDIDTFIQNIDKIEIEDMPEEIGASFLPDKKEIIVNKKIFENQEINYESIFSSIIHECMHAMNFIDKDNYKIDRTFDFKLKKYDPNQKGIMELFTECEANALVYNVSKQTESEILIQNETSGYSKITSYIDLIAAAFGVPKKDLLSAAIKGRKELQELLNEHIPNKKMENGENKIFYRMEKGINELSQMYIPSMPVIVRLEGREKYTLESIKLAYNYIYIIAEHSINVRISNISTEDMDEFKKQFDKIRLHQKIISKVNYGEDTNPSKDIKELKKLKDEKMRSVSETIVYMKLWYIQEILQNENITDKAELIKFIQNINDSRKMFEIEDFMSSNGISLPEELVIEIPEEALEKYNEEYTSNGMVWDNTKIIEYIKQHENELKGESMQQTNAKTTETGSTSWDLENWGIDKEELDKENEKIVEGYLNRESEGKTHDITLDEHDREEIE